MSDRRPNRFAPSLQALDAREVPAVILNTLADGSTEVFINDLGSGADTIVVRDFGNGTVAGQDNAISFSASNVTKIRINTEGGNDAVRYELIGSLQDGRQMSVEVGLGSNFDPTVGNDRFEAILDSGVTLGNKSNLSISADGGNGRDYLSVTAIDVNVRPDATLKTVLVGGYDDDTIAQLFRYGTNYGTVDMESYGLSGADTIRQYAEFGAASTGHTVQLAYGGDGADTANVTLIAPTTMTIDDAELFGDNGPADTYVDTFLNATPNVTVHQ
ncbi:MAG: hypothetical protein J0I06_20180 [Planctomycetes bacterium]|nr:hypothetical protein [Planctomycetota bacterium]